MPEAVSLPGSFSEWRGAHYIVHWLFTSWLLHRPSRYLHIGELFKSIRYRVQPENVCSSLHRVSCCVRSSNSYYVMWILQQVREGWCMLAGLWYSYPDLTRRYQILCASVPVFLYLCFKAGTTLGVQSRVLNPNSRPVLLKGSHLSKFNTFS